MLTAAQCRTVAYNTEDRIVCTNCVKPTDDCSANEIIEYSAEEMAGDDGLYCDDCGKAIIEPAERCDKCGDTEYDCTCDEDENTATDDTDEEK